MGQSVLNILYVEAVLGWIADNLVLKGDSGPYPKNRCQLLLLCCVASHLLSVPVLH